MKDNKDDYWQDVENKKLDSNLLKNEFAESELSFDVSSIKKHRRNFLKLMGFTFSAFPLSSCRRSCALSDQTKSRWIERPDD